MFLLEATTQPQHEADGENPCGATLHWAWHLLVHQLYEDMTPFNYYRKLYHPEAYN